jgi:hypothetical protein
MRAALKWGLLASVCTALAVSLWPGFGADPIAAAGGPATPTLTHHAAARPAPGGTDAVRAPWPALSPAARSAWLPPAPPPVPRAAAAPASAAAPPPPFPYRWFGQLDDGGTLEIFLASPQRTRVATLGEVLEQRWRIEGVAMGRLQVTWLPTGATLQIGRR